MEAGEATKVRMSVKNTLLRIAGTACRPTKYQIEDGFQMLSKFDRD